MTLWTTCIKKFGLLKLYFKLPFYFSGVLADTYRNLMKNLAIALGVFTGLFAFTCIILMAVMLLVSKKKKDKKVITREEEIPESTDDRVSIFCLFRFNLIDVIVYCWKILLEFKKKK